MAVSRRLRFEVLRRDGHACRYCGASAPDVALTVDHVIPTALGGSDESSNLVTACSNCNAGKTSISPDSGIVADVAADALRWARALEAAASNLLADREIVSAATQRFLDCWNGWTYEFKVTVPPPPVEPTGDVLVDSWYSIVWGWIGLHCRPVGFANGVLTIQVERGYITEAKRALRLSEARRHMAQLLGAEVDRVEVADGWPGPVPRAPCSTTRLERRSFSLPSGWRESVERFISLGLPEEELHRLVRVTMESHPDDHFRFFCGCCWRTITDLQEDARRIVESEADSVT